MKTLTNMVAVITLLTTMSAHAGTEKKLVFNQIHLQHCEPQYDSNGKMTSGSGTSMDIDFNPNRDERIVYVSTIEDKGKSPLESEIDSLGRLKRYKLIIKKSTFNVDGKKRNSMKVVAIDRFNNLSKVLTSYYDDKANINVNSKYDDNCYEEASASQMTSNFSVGITTNLVVTVPQ